MRLLAQLSALAVCIGAAVSAPSPARELPTERTSAQSTREYEVKAACLVKFIGYVKWPERAFKNADARLVVGIVGPDPFGRVLDDAFNGKSVGKRKIEVKRFKTTAELDACHMLFVSDLEIAKLPQILDKTAGHAVLTVCESEGAASRGAVINFVIEDKKVRFEINPESAKRADVEVSSQLLKLAKLVKDEVPR